MEENYDELLEKIKNKFAEEIKKVPDHKYIKFEICNGVLWSIGLMDIPRKLVNDMQIFVNQELGQKEYIGEFIIRKTVFAKNEEQAREYFKQTESSLFQKLHNIFEFKLDE